MLKIKKFQLFEKEMLLFAPLCMLTEIVSGVKPAIIWNKPYLYIIHCTEDV